MLCDYVCCSDCVGFCGNVVVYRVLIKNRLVFEHWSGEVCCVIMSVVVTVWGSVGMLCNGC